MPNPEWCRVVHGSVLASGSTAMRHCQKTQMRLLCARSLARVRLARCRDRARNTRLERGKDHRRGHNRYKGGHADLLAFVAGDRQDKFDSTCIEFHRPLLCSDYRHFVISCCDWRRGRSVDVACGSRSICSVRRSANEPIAMDARPKNAITASR
jgi:hypothetical protein